MPITAITLTLSDAIQKTAQKKLKIRAIDWTVIALLSGKTTKVNIVN